MINRQPDPQTSLHIQRMFPAPRDRVFRAWTDPKALERWFRPFGMPISVARLDLHLGGDYQFVIHDPSGHTSTISGQYVEIVQPEKLVYTWISDATDHGETLVTMTFAERGKMTELNLIHERFGRPDFVRPHEEGWMGMMNALETVFIN